MAEKNKYQKVSTDEESDANNIDLEEEGSK